MLTIEFARSILIPLFVLNMAAMVITIFMKKDIKPEFSANLNKIFIVENVIGLVCCLALGYISFFVKH